MPVTENLLSAPEGEQQPGSPSIAAPILSFEPANKTLLNEICSFREDSMARYRFNNTWDVFLSIFGILLSIAVVACGFLRMPIVSAILGAFVAAVVTAQKAFPFGQRASFYRLLIGQSSNLATRASQEVIGKTEAVNTLSSMRMDFAQQLPRGSSTTDQHTTAPADNHPNQDAETETEK